MVRAAIIVEGKGDVKSVPSLLAKTAAAFEMQLIPSEPPIKAGEALKLRRTGELERYLRLAGSRDEVEVIFVIVDLDDGCPRDFFEDFSARSAPIVAETGKPVHICFLVREYEVLFLSDLPNLTRAMPEFGIPEGSLIDNPHLIRGAKETFRNLCKVKGYKQTRDQNIVTKKLDVLSLDASNRSFRKIVKCITGKNYQEIDDFLLRNIET